MDLIGNFPTIFHNIYKRRGTIDTYTVGVWIAMKCEYCDSSDVVKYGYNYQGGKSQRWLCKSCGRTFTKDIVDKVEEDLDNARESED